MDTQDSTVAWVLLALVVVVLLAGTVVRWVPTGGLVLVIRRGVTIRVHGRGVAWRVPLLERIVPLENGPASVLTTVRATTADDEDVRVLVTADVRLGALPTGRPFSDPWVAARSAVETALAAVVTQHRACDLPEALADRLDGVRARADATARAAGATVDGVNIDEIEVLLVPGVDVHGPD